MKKTTSSAKKGTGSSSPSRSSDARSRDREDWRDETLQRVRDIIRKADPEIVEVTKWQKPSNNMRGVPVWERNGMICTGEKYKDKVKFTFSQGASLEDPAGLFNASLDGKVRRAIDIYEGAKLDEKAFKALIRAAVARNTAVRNLRSR